MDGKTRTARPGERREVGRLMGVTRAPVVCSVLSSTGSYLLDSCHLDSPALPPSFLAGCVLCDTNDQGTRPRTPLKFYSSSNSWRLPLLAGDQRKCSLIIRLKNKSREGLWPSLGQVLIPKAACCRWGRVACTPRPGCPLLGRTGPALPEKQ